VKLLAGSPALLVDEPVRSVRDPVRCVVSSRRDGEVVLIGEGRHGERDQGSVCRGRRDRPATRRPAIALCARTNALCEVAFLCSRVGRRRVTFDVIRIMPWTRGVRFGPRAPRAWSACAIADRVGWTAAGGPPRRPTRGKQGSAAGTEVVR
jgi:hypothetical protein